MAMALFAFVLGAVLSLLDVTGKGAVNDQERNTAVSEDTQALALMIRELRQARAVVGPTSGTTSNFMDVRLRLGGVDRRVLYRCDVPAAEAGLQRCVRYEFAANDPSPAGSFPAAAQTRTAVDRLVNGTAARPGVHRAVEPGRGGSQAQLRPGDDQDPWQRGTDDRLPPPRRALRRIPHAQPGLGAVTAVPPARAQDGFAIAEILVAIMVISLAVMALVSVFDGSRRLATNAEKHNVASAMANKELERVTAQPWKKLALAAAPAASTTDPDDPTYYLSAGPCGTGLPASSPCYRYSWADPTKVEPLVVDPTDGDAMANPQTWSAPSPAGGTRLSGDIYRFVTWVDDPNCLSAACGGAGAYKRVLVAVTVNGVSKPTLVSTLVQNPAGGTVRNPLANGATCLEGGSSVPCTE